MIKRIDCEGLLVDTALFDFIEQEALPGTNVDVIEFWNGLRKLLDKLVPKNRLLLAERDRLQNALTTWHRENPGPVTDVSSYRLFLESIGYLQPPVTDFTITTSHVDTELGMQAGPQLVVPLINARYAINAANARWGSLYDALYGTDAVPENSGALRTQKYNPLRGLVVIDFARRFLNDVLPMAECNHNDVVGYQIKQGRLAVQLKSGTETYLQNPNRFLGYSGEEANPNVLLFVNNGLHFELIIDRNHPIGQADPAGISDIMMEAAVSTIMDCEDSIAAVDAEDKILVYRNWLGLMQGDLTTEIQKGNKTFTRRLHEDRTYHSIESISKSDITLPGRSLLLVRNVGHLMTNPAIILPDGSEIPEGLLDAVCTSLIAMHDLNRHGNSRTGSIYIVKPKMHGSDEVAFTNEIFGHVEELLNLPINTLKMGIMDEERRTSVNLQAAIFAARDRVVFINTGFLDRTGDEMHSVMAGGPVMRKADMKDTEWIKAYERNNVLVGLSCGLRGKGQIGKGMWAMPELMADMLKHKIAHPEAGANTAWVPSPTAAVLHALHYHMVDVQSVQVELEKILLSDEREALLTGLLTPPFAANSDWNETDKQQELDNNVQGILGYVVRWINQGIGCSKVPDIHNVDLMEDRATLRISSQHIANWLQHGIVDTDQVMSTFRKMAMVVDG